MSGSCAISAAPHAVSGYLSRVKNWSAMIADAAHMVEADYFGVESGNRASDKFARSGLTASKVEAVDAPVINEFPICLECKFIEYQSNEYGCGVIGKVVMSPPMRALWWTAKSICPK